MKLDARINTAWWMLRIGLGLCAFLAGLDKFLNLLTDWTMYLSPLATQLVPVSASTFMHIVGVVEMLVGLSVLTRWTGFGAYVTSAWLVGIAVNLVTTGMFFDLAVRDLEIALAAFVLARITEVRQEAFKSKAERSDGFLTLGLAKN
jgi:hypothetical protein